MRKIIFAAVLALMIGCAQLAAALPITVGFAPDSLISVTGTGGYSVDVMLANLPSGGIVSAFNLSVLYSSSYLKATGVFFSDLLGDAGNYEVLQQSMLLTPGTINFSSVSLLSDATLASLQGPAGSVRLATLYFDGVSNGTTGLAFNWAQGLDVKGAENKIIAGFVPEPASILPMGLGLLALLGYCWRKKLLKRY